MPITEQTPNNKLYRYAIGTASPLPTYYSLAEFWTLYKSTFEPSWDIDGVTYGSPRSEMTITLIAPWGELVVYPLPPCIGATRRRVIQDAIDAGRALCSECHNWRDKDTLENVTVDGDTALYCESCKDQLHTCERCEEHTTEPHAVHNGSRRSRDEQEWCESCREDHAQRCDDCRDYYSNDSEGMSYGNNWYCESCSENYSTCDTCGTLLSNDEARYDEDSGNTYCERHVPDDDDDDDDDSDNEAIHGYSYHPRPIFHGDTKLPHYGVENEMTCDRDYAEDTLDHFGGEDHVYLKKDSSIVGGGFEIVTHPHTLDAHRKLWDGFNSFARSNGFKANSNGMHVHIGREYLTPYRIAKIQTFLNRQDNYPLVTAIAQRSSRSWAKCNPDLAKALRCTGDGSRYSALNLENTNTVEIRIFRGTIRKSEFFKNLEFCDALVNWSVDRSHSETGAGDFLSYVRGNRKAYPALDAFLVEVKYLPAMKTDTRKKEVPAVEVSAEVPACV